MRVGVKVGFETALGSRFEAVVGVRFREWSRDQVSG